MITAPDLYGLNDTELANELRNIDASHTVELEGPVTITTGMRRCPLDGSDHPVVVVCGADGLHLLALPSNRAAS